MIGIENPIREASGINTRPTYKTWKHVHGQRGIDELTKGMGAVMTGLNRLGFKEDEVWNWAQTRPAARKLFMYGYNGHDWTDLERQERKDLRDLISAQLLDEARSALPTFRDDFLASKVQTLLLPKLVQISGDPNKAAALMAGLSTAERIQALDYLLANRKNLAPVQALLHFGKPDLFGTTESKRAAARLAALRTLITGGTIATATTQRETVSSILPCA